MTDDASTAPPKSFLWIAGVALVWNLLGVMAYLDQVLGGMEAFVADMPAEEAALFMNIPAWATSAYAIAVHAGALGAIALLLKKAWSYPLFIGSLAGVVVQQGHTYFMTDAISYYGIGMVIMPTVVLAVSIYLVWYSKTAKDKGWTS